MLRWVLALVAVGFALAPVRAADPKPLWEIDLGPAAKPKVKPHANWLAFSKESALVAVTSCYTTDYEYKTYKLRAWGTKTRNEWFTADLGEGQAEGRAMPHAALVGDDRVLTVGGKAGAVVHDLTGGKEIARLGGPRSLRVVWATPDAKDYFALRTTLGDTHLDAGTTVIRSAVPTPALVKGAPPVPATEARLPVPREALEPRVVAFNPARDRLVIGYHDDLGRVGTPRHTLAVYKVGEKLKFDAVATIVPPHPGDVSAIAFSPDGRTLATGSADGTVCLWDMAEAGDKWKPTAKFTAPGLEPTVYALAFRPDGKALAVGTFGKKSTLWLVDVTSGKLVREMTIGSVMALAFSPDGKHLATSAAYEGSIRVWDADELMKAK